MKKISFLVVLLLFLPFISAQMDFWQPYSDKIVYAQTDYPTGTTYTLFDEGNIVVSGTTSTTFLAHFDNFLLSSENENPLTTISESYENTVFNQGFKGVIEYNTTNNLDLSEGTIEMWITFKKPLDDPVFDNDKYFFKHSNNFYIGIHPDNYLYTYISDGVNNLYLRASYYEVPVNAPVNIVITYSKNSGLTSFYIDGFKVAQELFNTNLMLSDYFTVGNNDVIIDEFRIQNRELSADEIKFNYLLGMPFSNNDILINKTFPEGNSLQLVVGSESLSKSVLSPKFTVNPDEYVLPYADTVSIIPSGSNCKHSDYPMPYSQMISGNINYDNPTTIDYIPVYIKCENDDYSFYRRYRILAQQNNNWPKLGIIFWGNSINAEEAVQLSRFDFVNIAPSNIMYPSIVKQIRENNPDVIIGYYSNILAPRPLYGVTNYYFYDFPLKYEWRLFDDSGNPKYQSDIFGDNPDIYNLYTGNVEYHQAYVNWMKETFFERGIFDGIWFDNFVNNAWWVTEHNADMDNDGVNDITSYYEGDILKYNYTKFHQLMDKGLEMIASDFRQKIGNNIIIIGNNPEEVYAANYLNGKFWERKTFDLLYHNFKDLTDPLFVRGYAYWYDHGVIPRFDMSTQFQANPYVEVPSWDRYGVAMSLFFDMYAYKAIFDQSSDYNFYRHVNWLDEYRVDLQTGNPTQDVSGKGYLGQPLNEYYEMETDIYRRDYKNGIVILNNNTVSGKTVTLEYSYRTINGTQDPLTNDGQLKNQITLGKEDAIILLRALCTDNPSNDPLCIGTFVGDPFDLSPEIGIIDINDLLVLIDSYGTLNGDANYYSSRDFNNDNKIDIIDLIILVDNFS